MKVGAIGKVPETQRMYVADFVVFNLKSLRVFDSNCDNTLGDLGLFEREEELIWCEPEIRLQRQIHVLLSVDLRGAWNPRCSDTLGQK